MLVDSLDNSSTPQRTVVKQERWTTAVIDRSGPGATATFVKRYLVPAWEAWRYAFGGARASRELRAMRSMRSAGIPCVEPTGYAEKRAPRCRLRWSEVRWSYRPGRDLAQVMPRCDRPQRNRLCRQLGELLARIHEAGFLWGTALPRNVIVTEGEPELVICDVPYAVRFDASIHGSRLAIVDLFTAIGSPSRRREFSNRERRRAVLAYTRGDRGAGRRIMRTLEHRSRTRHRTVRGWLRFLIAMHLPILSLRPLRPQ